MYEETDDEQVVGIKMKLLRETIKTASNEACKSLSGKIEKIYTDTSWQEPWLLLWTAHGHPAHKIYINMMRGHISTNF